MKEKSNKFWEKIAIIFSLIGLIVLTIFIIQVNRFYELSIKIPIDMSDTGNIGDFIGGVVGTFFSIAATILIFLTYQSQKIELKETRKILLMQEFNNNLNSWIELYRNFSQNSTTELKNSPISGTVNLTNKVIEEISRIRNQIHMDFNIHKISKSEFDEKLKSNDPVGCLTNMQEIHPYLKHWIYLICAGFNEINHAKEKEINIDNKQILMYSLITTDEVYLLEDFLNVKGAPFVLPSIRKNFSDFVNSYKSKTMPMISMRSW